MSQQLNNMVAASGVTAADIMYLVQSLTDKQVSIATLFANLPVPVGTSEYFQAVGTPELISSGAISVVTPLSNLALSGNTTITLAAGVQGQIKTIIAISTGGSSSAVINANIGHTSITFTKAGSTANLMYDSGAWYFIGGTATVV
jgi:hypothetical protein